MKKVYTTTKFHLSRAAGRDLRNILEYTAAQWSRTQAYKYYGTLMNACRAVANNPALGENYKEIAEDLYGFRAGRHILFCRIVSPGEITIVRILHGRMDLKSRIQE